MKPRDRKLTVLRQLSQEADPISWRELLDRLHGEFPERTVRRWLEELVAEGLLQKTGHRRSTTYQVVNKNGVRSANPSSCFGSDSLKALDHVRQPILNVYYVLVY